MKHYTITLIAILLLLPSLILARDDTQTQPSTPTITSLVWSPDGTKIAASFDDKTVKVWSLNPDGSQLITPPLLTFKPELVDNIKWTSDSKYLVTQGKIASETGLIGTNVAKWDAQTSHFIENLFDYRMETHYKFDPLAYYVYPVISFDSGFNHSAFSINSRMVTLSNDKDIPSVLFVEIGVVQSVLWSQDDSRLAVTSGGDDTYNVQTFDVLTGDLINTIHGPDYHAYDMAWSSDNSHLAVTSIWANPFNPSANVRVYDIHKGNDYLTDGDMNFGFDLVQNLPNQSRNIPVVAWYPKANILVISYASTINFYAVPSKQPIKTIFAENIVSLTYAPDGKHLAGSDPEGRIKIWDVSDLE